MGETMEKVEQMHYEHVRDGHGSWTCWDMGGGRHLDSGRGVAGEATCSAGWSHTADAGRDTAYIHRPTRVSQPRGPMQLVTINERVHGSGLHTWVAHLR